MATQADGEGRLSLKEQEPLLKVMTCVIFSHTTTSCFVLFDREREKKKGGDVLEKTRGSSPVSMTLCIIFVCEHPPPYIISSGNSSCLLPHTRVLSFARGCG